MFTINCMAATELSSQKKVNTAFAKHRPMIIMFYTTWCPACKATKPAYIKAEKILAGKVDFYLMNVEIGELKMREEIDSIPSFVAGVDREDIRSARSLKSGSMSVKQILQYIRKYTGINKGFK